MNQQEQPWYLRPGSVRALMGVIAALVVFNVWTVWTLGKVWERVQNLPTHISSGSSAQINMSPLLTGVQQSYTQLLSYDVGETVTVAIDVQMAERIPGYELFVRYREYEQGVLHEWSVVKPELVDGLDYRAIVELSPDANYEYQIMQTQEGEIVRLTHGHHIRLSQEIGSPDVTVYIVTDPRVRLTKLTFSQNRHWQLEAWAIEQVSVTLDNVADPIVTAWRDHDSHTVVEVDSRLWEAAKVVELTVRYRDGETRSISFTQGAHRPDPLVIRRN